MQTMIMITKYCCFTTMIYKRQNLMTIFANNLPIHITYLFYSVMLNVLGGFIHRKCSYPETCCRVQRGPRTTQTQMLKLVIIQLIKSSISQEKKFRMRIQQYSDYYKAKKKC